MANIDYAAEFPDLVDMPRTDLEVARRALLEKNGNDPDTWDEASLKRMCGIMAFLVTSASKPPKVSKIAKKTPTTADDFDVDDI